MPILVHGDAESHKLYDPCNRVVNSTTLRIQTLCRSLRLSAKTLNVYSLSANQLKCQDAIFTMYKDLIPNQWIADEETELDIDNYEVYINPIILAETNHTKFDFEYCASYPAIRA